MKKTESELERAERMHPSVQAYLSEIGKRGGSAKSDAKTAAVRENARKPRRRKLKADEEEASESEQAGSDRG